MFLAFNKQSWRFNGMLRKLIGWNTLKLSFLRGFGGLEEIFLLIQLFERFERRPIGDVRLPFKVDRQMLEVNILRF